MKITPREADRFIQQPGAEVAVVLLYGPDTGLVKERAQSLVTVILGADGNPFGLSSVSIHQISENSSLLASERSAISFGGGRRVIQVAGAVDRIHDAVSLACDAPGDGLVVLEAGELSPRSKLRKFCEKASNAAAIACYGDDDRALGAMIEQTLSQEGLFLEPSAKRYLLENLGNDRLVTRGEIEKLVVYMGDEGPREISLADAQACVFDNDLKDMSDLVGVVAEGRMQPVMAIFATTLEGGAHPVGVLRALQRFFQRLHLVAEQVRGGSSVSQAVDGLRPLVFFKEKPQFVKAASRFPVGKVSLALDLLTEAEKACKSGKGPDISICERALLRLVQLGR